MYNGYTHNTHFLCIMKMNFTHKNNCCSIFSFLKYVYYDIVLAALRANALRNPIQAFQNARKSGSSGKFKARLLRWGLEETPDPLELLSLSEAPKLIIATGCVYVHSNFLPFPFLSFLFLFLPFPLLSCLCRKLSRESNRFVRCHIIFYFISLPFGTCSFESLM